MQIFRKNERKKLFQIAISVIIILILVSFYYNFLRQDAKEASDFDKNKKNKFLFQ